MRNLWIWIVVFVIVIGGGYWWWQSMQTPAMTDMSGMDTQVTQTTPSTTPAPMSASVVYDGKSFTPSTVTIAKGGTVTYTSTAGDMWVASDPHPNHDGYDGNAQSVHCAAGYGGPAPFDECSAGISFTFVFTKTGTWGYHDHINDDVGGTVIVQ